MPSLEFVPHTSMDMSEWHFGLDDLFDCPDSVAAKAFTKAVENTLKETSPQATLPWAWCHIGDAGDGVGGPAVPSPDIIYFDFPLGDWDSPPTWSISLTELVEDYINGGAGDGGEGQFDPDAAPFVKQLSSKLRELADRLDAKLD